MGQYSFAGCRLSSSVTLPAGGPAGRRERGNATWERCQTAGMVGAPAARHVGGQAADTAQRASRVTSR